MNRHYRVLWSNARQAYVVAPEKAGTAGGRSIAESSGDQSAGRAGRWRRNAAAALLLATSTLACPALADTTLPAGAMITQGAASITSTGNAMTVQQSSQQLITNWQSFSIGADAAVTFKQPDSSSVALNRVLGQDPSRILGALNANGQVFLINPNGVVFGQNAQVNTGALVASTLGISDQQFLDGTASGSYRFGGPDSGTAAGDILNKGSLSGAVVALIAPVVRNQGSITGDAALAGGTDVTLDFSGDGLLGVTVNASTLATLVDNQGLIRADGGHVILTARGASQALTGVVNHSGTIQAQTLEEKDGRILLLGDMDHGTAHVSGTLDASAPDGGDGGFIETSAARVRFGENFAVTTAAPAGKTGQWLIDPFDFTIAADGGDITGAQLNAALEVSDVTIETLENSVSCDVDNCAGGGAGNGDIFVNDTVMWDRNILTLSAWRNIAINAEMTFNGSNAGGGLALAFAQGDSTGGYSVNAPVNLTAGSLFSTQYGNDTAVVYTVITELGMAGDELDNSNNTLQGLADADRLSGNYVLGANIDASPTAGWNANTGFVPIGNNATDDLGSRFSGTFDGLGHTISGLTINRPSTDFVGLLGHTEGADIRNLGLLDSSLTGKLFVGSLAGNNYASSRISNAYATGTVTGYRNVGGLVGGNSGSSTLTDVYATGAVTGLADNVALAGGLLGFNAGSDVINAHATGHVTGEGYIGGFAGGNYDFGNFINVYASGNVAGTGGKVAIGGLVGQNDNSTIANAYATGSVSGTYWVGGLVGVNSTDGVSDATISNTYATGAVSGDQMTGGLVGQNFKFVLDSFWDRDTTGQLAGLGGGESPSLTSLSSTEALVQDNYTGFDFSDDWYMVDGQTRPFLRSEYSTTITNAHQLQMMAMDLTADYTLARDIDLAPGLTNLAGMWATDASDSMAISGAGFAPIGNNATDNLGSRFSGTFDGLGHTISGLTINRPSTDFVGLFGFADGASIRNTGLVGGNISGNGYVGGLVGLSGFGGLISHVHTTGSVQGHGLYVGGLAGANDHGTIAFAYATGNVTSTSDVVGGLVGSNWESNGNPLISNISNSFATGDVSGIHSVGGLVGANWANNTWNGPSISNAYATGIVRGEDRVGGLVGYNRTGSAIDNAYATGAVHGASEIGGLVGSNADSSIISNAYATGNVQGSGDFVGGLAGVNVDSEITHAHATGPVESAGSRVGGLVGLNESGQISHVHATGSVTGLGTHVGGLVGDNTRTSSIITAYATGSVTGSNDHVGGLVGVNWDSSRIEDVFAIGDVTGLNGANNVGGLVGLNSAESSSNGSSITNAYATGAVRGENQIGGLVGLNRTGSLIENAYATGHVIGQIAGGFVGENSNATISNSFWDTESTGHMTGIAVGDTGGATGKTTAEMQSLATFTDVDHPDGGLDSAWDIDDLGGTGTIWRIYDGHTSPLLRSFMTELTISAVDGSKIYDGLIPGAPAAITYSLDTVDASLVLGSPTIQDASRNVGDYSMTTQGLYSTQSGYDLIHAVAAVFRITPAAISISTDAVTKDFDGTLNAAGNAMVVGGQLFGPDSLSGGSFAFTDPDPGTGKTVTVAGVSIEDGNQGGNYAVTYVPNTNSTLLAAEQPAVETPAPAPTPPTPSTPPTPPAPLPEPDPVPAPAPAPEPAPVPVPEPAPASQNLPPPPPMSASEPQQNSALPPRTLAGLMTTALAPTPAEPIGLIGDSGVRAYAALVDDLRDAFPDWAIGHDRETLQIHIDGLGMLFARGADRLQPGLRTALDAVALRLLGVLMRHRDLIEAVTVQGHSSSEWRGAESAEQAQALNMALSLARASHVHTAILGLLEGRQAHAWIGSRLSIMDQAQSSPVRDANGKEDAVRSRRVSFQVTPRNHQDNQQVRVFIGEPLSTTEN